MTITATLYKHPVQQCCAMTITARLHNYSHAIQTPSTATTLTI